jgi:hypothetical protein
MQSDGDYPGQGHLFLENLLPKATAQTLLAHLRGDIAASGAELRQFLAPSTAIGHEAIGIYGYLYPRLTGLLWGMMPVVSSIAGTELLPTYSYLRIYRKGEVCRIHTDRQACEHSLSLTLAYSDDIPWALDVACAPQEPMSSMADDFGTSDHFSLPMQAGDAVLYQGITHSHGRLRPNPNRWSAHVFLHWVERDGPYRDFAFDGLASDPGTIDFDLS